MSNPPFKLFIYPSRGRPDRFFKSLDSLVDNISDKDYYYISCNLDLDDDTMNNEEVKSKIAKYENVSVEWGYSKSKIDAVNRSLPDIKWDILFVHSDDMIFTQFGFDTMVGVDMMNWFPNMDGLLHYPDQDAKEHLATMVIMGRNFFNKFNFIYDPRFKSLWCDNLLQAVAIYLDKYKYCGYQINLHLCPAYGYLEKDALFLEQQGHWDHDQLIHDTTIANGLDNYLKQFNI